MTVINTNSAAALAEVVAKRNMLRIRASMTRLSRSNNARSAFTDLNAAAAAAKNFEKFSNDPRVVAGLTVQKLREDGVVKKDTQLGGNWGFKDDRIEKINRQEEVAKEAAETQEEIAKEAAETQEEVAKEADETQAQQRDPNSLMARQRAAARAMMVLRHNIPLKLL